MVPDFQTLMRPVLEAAKDGEVRVRDVVELLAVEFNLSNDEQKEMLPSGTQSRFANRVHWARSYLKQAGLLQNVRRGYFTITKSGIDTLNSKSTINSKFLEKFDEFMEFKNRTRKTTSSGISTNSTLSDQTPDETLRLAYQNINDSLAAELLDRIKESSPEFFENLIIELLLKMGYGADDASGKTLGQSGDNGVDGVINQDSLGVDQVYVQAKRYSDSNTIGSGAIRDFYGALGLKDVTKGIFVTTSSFSKSAKHTAEKLGVRIVMIDGIRLAQLMIQYEVGCRVEQVIKLAKLDENFFD